MPLGYDGDRRDDWRLGVAQVGHRCVIRLPSGKEATTAAFSTLLAQKVQVEQAFGGELEWQDLPDRLARQIGVRVSKSWRSPESEWLWLGLSVDVAGGRV